MGACFSDPTKVGGSSSSSTGSAVKNLAGKHQHKAQRTQKKSSNGKDQQRKQQEQNPRQNQQNHREKGEVKRTNGVVPYGKRTNFGYPRDFESKYEIGKLLGHGHFGYTFVAIDKANGNHVAVKRINKQKVFLLRVSLCCGFGNLSFPFSAEYFGSLI